MNAWNGMVGLVLVLFEISLLVYEWGGVGAASHFNSLKTHIYKRKYKRMGLLDCSLNVPNKWVNTQRSASHIL
jgi:hypothetical protein